MSLDPIIKSFLEKFYALPRPPLQELSPQKYRVMEAESEWLMSQPKEPVAKVEEFTIPLEGRDIRVRAYAPNDNKPLPALVFYHGGGWVIGSLDTHDNMCRAIANRAECAVFSVEYRLAPESKFPAALYDAYDALVWIADHASDLGILPDRIAVGGDSAGGNLAAVTCLLAKERKGPHIAHQLLLYPYTGYKQMPASFLENAEGYFLSAKLMEWFSMHYVNNLDELNHPYFSPVLVEDLQGLPPATLVTSQYDPLRDVGSNYAEKLKDNGVPVYFKNYDGLIHGFANFIGFVPAAHKAFEETVDQFKKALSPQL